MTRTAATTVVLLAPLFAVAAEPTLKGVEEQVQKVIDAASPSVVSVVVSHSKKHKVPDKPTRPGQLGGVDPTELIAPPEPRPFPGRRPAQAFVHPLDLSAPENVADHTFGSGVVLDSATGLVLVPYHLIDGARKVYVRGANGKGSYADLHAADSKSDLAVLRLITPVRGWEAAKLAEVRLIDGSGGEKPTLKRGSVVIALGHSSAASVGEGTAAGSWGVVSAVRQRSAPPPAADTKPVIGQPPPKALHQYGGLIQVDARVALGQTGAGVFNADGELVGLGSAVAAVYGSEANGGYAVPMDGTFRRIVAALKDGREVEYGFLGISPDEVPGGVMVGGVTAGCPAFVAGITEGDVITAIDGHPLRSNDDLFHRVGGSLAGSDVKVEFTRGGQKQSVKLTLAKNLNTMTFVASNLAPTPWGLSVDWYSIKYAGGGFRDRFPKAVPAGVLLREMETGSSGEKALKAAGVPKGGAWIITQVDGKPTPTPKEYHAATKGKTSVTLSLADPDDSSNKPTVTVP